jgi:hypothetical protein
VPDDRLAAAIAELYGAAPDAFTERRGELAAAARDAGDRTAAKAIAGLRRPTRAAWVVNRLARTDPNAPHKLAELAAALRAAQAAGHGPRLRELSAARGALVDALTAQALTAADVADPPPSLRLEVSETLTAALADPEAAAAFAAGTLTRAVQWSGFGVLPADAEPEETEAAEETGPDAVGVAPRAAGQPEGASRSADRVGGGGRGARTGAARDAARSGVRREQVGQRGERSGGGARGRRTDGDTHAGQPAKRGGTARRARAGADVAEPAAGRGQAEAEDWLARDTAERAARRQEQRAEAERVVADASAATAEAEAAEDRLEAEVRDLEQRLTRARADLAAARMRARRAEAAERRARQDRDRLLSE